MRRAFAVLRAAVITPLFVSIWMYFLPRWFGGARAFHDPRAAGWAVVAAGMAVMLACVWEFAWRGLGTPAPFDPPRKLVISGLYRYVRNPMYVGMVIALLGEAVVFPHLARGLLLETAAFWAAVSLFVLAFEEPMLRRLFGGDYEQYRGAVGRWIPRVTPWYAPPHLE